MKTLFTILALMVAVSLNAAEGFITKSASGTTSAAVIYPAGPPLRITAYDVTADNATNRLVFQVGGVSATVKKAAAANATEITVTQTSITTNDVIVIQTAAELVTNKTVTINADVTNKVVQLQRPLGTNLAVGDTVRKIHATGLTVLAPVAANGTSVLLSQVAGLEGSDALVLDRGGRAALGSAAVTSGATNVRSYFTVKSPIAEAVAIATAVYEQLTNKAVTLATTADAATNRLTVATTNGIAVDKWVLHEAANGALSVYTVTNFDGTTNLLVSPPVANSAAVGDNVFVLHPTSYTAILPAAPGDRSLILSAATALASNDTVVVNSATHAWRTRLAAAAVNTNIYTLTLADDFGYAAQAGNVVYKLTNSHLTALTGLRTDHQVTLNNATNLSSGDRLVITPASGGLFENQMLGAAANDPVTTLTVSVAIGNAVSPGDNIFLLSDAGSILVGNATKQATGESIFAIPRGRPLRVVLTGATACNINQITGKYE